MTLETEMLTLGQAAQNAGHQLRLADETARNTALKAMAAHIRADKTKILLANQADMPNGLNQMACIFQRSACRSALLA